MAIYGPSNVTISPNPYTTNVTISWNGLSFSSDLTRNHRLQYSFYDSVDNVTWPNTSYPTEEQTISSSAYTGSISATPAAAIPYGYYIRLLIRARASDNRIPQNWQSGSYVYAYGRKISASACGAPTAFSVNATVSEGNVTLSWSGASSGTGNTLSSYEIQYSESANGSTWGAWAALTTVSTTATSGSLVVAPPTTRGYYRRYQVRTRGSAGASYYSGWKVSTNTLRRNTLPIAPTVFTATPEKYTTENVTLTWSGAAAGTSSIKQYVIQKQESSDDMVTWGAWSAVTTISSSATSGNTTISPTRALGVYTQYRIVVQDTLDCLSAYKGSNPVYSLALPLAPSIPVPRQETVTINRNPKILIHTQAPPGGAPQTIYVRCANGTTYNSVDHPERFSVSGAHTVPVKTIFTCPDTLPGATAITVYCRTTLDGDISQRDFTVAASPFVQIVADRTRVRTVHITSLRTAINQARNSYGLSTYQWADTITSGWTNTAYWPFHIQELRAAMQPLLDMVAEYGGHPQRLGASWLPLGSGRPRADVMNELIAETLNL